jgi:hypothetical protein
MSKSITYGNLYDKLRDLGFTPRGLEMNGKPRYVFEHKTLANAMIVLPDRDRNDSVEPFYMSSVLATLKAHDLVQECNPLTA